VNDWQELYNMTEGITPAALHTIAALRDALADGAVSKDQVHAALAKGWDGITELLETTTAPAGEDTESFEESFSPFGRLV
jgi:hypothetical protein